MSKEAGGFAFPQTGTADGDGDIFESARLGGGGMTLRDYFAAKAMQGMLANGVPSGDIPLYAYEIADAMVSIRGQ